MKRYLLFLCIGLLFFMSPQSAFAHKMVVEQVDAGVIHVRYDDGTAARLAIVSAFNDDGHLLFEQQVNEDGDLHYDKEVNVYRFVADDGLGHRASSVVTEEPTMLESIPISIRALLGVSLLLFIAAIFLFRKR
ncbi:hypothetical protein [Bacillus sp. B15-48]|uniref:hypothetical protein n=1 Tax=Bacillus sp. B15-48 TaxID=1548601 RepID=UPI00193FE35C|nr:hypothetical protein [Bacillus sp. B15-48]MBM4761481.1 hypothetical protein [Bacillus sp. B15-48]